MNSSINRLILDKLAERDISDNVKKFIRDILQHEKGHMNQERPQYTREYNNLLNRYAKMQHDMNDIINEA